MSDLQLQHDQQLVIVEQLRGMIRDQETTIKKQAQDIKVRRKMRYIKTCFSKEYLGRLHKNQIFFILCCFSLVYMHIL